MILDMFAFKENSYAEMNATDTSLQLVICIWASTCFGYTSQQPIPTSVLFFFIPLY